MQKDWHTIDTTTEKIVRQMFSRPKVALRWIKVTEIDGNPIRGV